MNSLRQRRLTLAILFGTLVAIGLLLYALYEQEFNELYPCVRCIYQRVGVMGIIFAGLLALSSSRLRLLGLLLTVGFAAFGYYHADIHTAVVKGLMIDDCGFRANFGVLGRWDKWLPILFEAGGDCADKSWQVLNMTMPEWMRIIFAGYFFGAILGFILWLKSLAKDKTLT